MTKQKRTRYRVLGLISLSLIIAAASYGFAAVNSNQTSTGIIGAEYGVKSSYIVSKIRYTLDIENPSTFTAVDFEIDQEGATVIAGVSATKKGPIIWADACEKSVTKWTCTFDKSIDVLAADWLFVSSRD
ncbi:MAG: hypothetical protein KAS84_03585 [Anaerolineales bacterium]|nr:hypothetical protein [Anaerolineales bacterium]